MSKQRESFRKRLAALSGHGYRAWRLAPAVDRRALFLALLLVLITSSTVSAVPALLGRLVNEVQASQQQAGGGDWQGLAGAYLGVVALVFIIREVLQACRKHLVSRSCARAEKSLLAAAAARLLRAELDFVSADRTGTLQGRVQRGVDGVVRLLRLTFQELAPALLTVVCAAGYALYVRPVIGMVLLGAAAATVGLVHWQRRAQKGLRLAVLETERALDGLLLEQVAGMEYLRAANTHEGEIARVAGVAEQRRRHELRQHATAALFDALKALTDWGFQTGIVVLGVLLALHGQAQVGDLLLLWYLGFNILPPLKDVHRLLDEAQECCLRLEDFEGVLTAPRDPSFAPRRPAGRTQAPPRPSSPQGGPLILVEDLVVEYATPEGGSKRALSGVSLEIRAGEIVGLAGRSGSGKSTLLKALLRLVHPSAGRVRLAGQPLERLSRAELAALAGYVGQSPFLFAGTVADNLRYGGAAAGPAELRRVVRRCAAEADLAQLPGGLDAVLTERGGNLSVGQRQKLALARALLRPTPLLLLDEATAALDNLSEGAVLRTLLSERGGRTMLMVAHRVSSLQIADRILVFDEGKLVESGSYDALVARGGAFARLVRHEGPHRARASPGRVETSLADQDRFDFPLD